MNKLKFLFCFLTFICLNKIHAYSQVVNAESVVSFVEKSLELKAYEQTEKSIPYSFYEELKKDGLLRKGNVNVTYTSLVKLKDRKYKSRSYDFIIEKWVIEDGNLLNNTCEVLSTVVYDSFYEKPPKVVLLEDNTIYVISTWGAVYREDLYKIRKELTQQYKMVAL